ncbi:hypothetical protein BH23GEM11_BH23GEM11_05660 [soil metagenome]
MTQADWIRVGATVLAGALAGGLTNTIAVWMLFHPYEPPRFLGRWRIRFLHGAIPKNQARLAAAVGRTVGNRLLTEDDLRGIMGSPDFRAAFDRRLTAFLDDILKKERGSLRELLPPEVLAEVSDVLSGVVDHLADRLDDWMAGPDFEGVVSRRTADLIERLADEPVGDFLTPAREVAVTAAVEGWLTSAVERDGFREAVDDYLDRGSQALLRPDRTSEEILPLGLAAALERAMASYLPVAVRRLSRLLEDPVARVRVEAALQDLFRRLLGDLRFHQRLVARLVVNEETLERVLDTVQAEGAERVAEMLREPDIQKALARGINEAVVDLMRRPVTDVLGVPGDDSVVRARETLSGWVLGMARDPATRTFLVEKLEAGMHKASEGTWGDLLRRVPPEKVAEGVVAAARSDAARQVYRNTLDRTLVRLRERPIGRPSDWLPEGAPARLEGALAEPLWGWLQGQIPEVVRTMDVARRVEEKVMAYPTDQLEALVRRVTERELRLIVRLGYVLGAMIGVVLVGVNRLLP